MRKRTKRSVVYHATPDTRHCFMAKSEVLANKHKAGTISQSEMEELAAFKALIQQGYKVTGASLKSKEPKMITITWGKLKIQITQNEYDMHNCKQLGF